MNTHSLLAAAALIPSLTVALPLPSLAASASLGLPRLLGTPSSSDDPPLDATHFSVFEPHSLAKSLGDHARVARAGAIEYIEIDPNTDWSAPLRPLHPGANYVTLTLQGSIGTIVDVGGAMFGLVDGGAPDFASVVVAAGDKSTAEWKPLRHDSQLAPYNGHPMATLAMFTIKTDTRSHTWSLYMADYLALGEADLPRTHDSRDHRVLSIAAGADGARLYVVACSDENPAFIDTNHNDVRDEFERKTLGHLLAENAPADLRAGLRDAWLQALRDEAQGRALLEAAHGADGVNEPTRSFDVQTMAPDPITDPAKLQPHSIDGIPSSLVYPDSEAQ